MAQLVSDSLRSLVSYLNVKVLSQLELLDLTTLPETFGPKDLDPTIRFFEYVEAHLPNEKGWKLDWDKVAVSAEEKEWWGGFLKSWREAKAGDPHQRLKGGAVGTRFFSSSLHTIPSMIVITNNSYERLFGP